MVGEGVLPGAFNQESPGGPTESAWIVIGDRQFKVVTMPEKVPKLVPEWCYGSFMAILVGTVIYAVTERRSSNWSAQVYWQKKSRFAMRYHLVVREVFPSIGEAKDRARDYVVSLENGIVPGASR